MDLVAPVGRLFASTSEPLALLVGVVLGLLFGLLPGVNGRSGLILSFPFIIGLDPMVGAIYLVAMHSVVHTCGALPAVLMGVPTSTSEAAVVLDGYPLVRQGRAWEAVAATVASSAIGGLIGAVALIAFVPIGMLLIPYISSAEVAAITVLGLVSVSALSGSSLARGLLVAALGVLAAAIGLDDLTGTQRYTFGSLTLINGLNLGAVVAGLFVIPELVLRSSAPPVHPVDIKVGMLRVLRGMTVVFRKFGLVVRSSIIGIIVGFIPGIGASVSVWIAYGHAVQTEKPDPPFGEGNVAGVIAAETADNAKEGGALAPTLMFGVPGTSGMAILLIALGLVGIDAGPRLFTADPGFVTAMGWVVLLANLIAVPICILIAPSLSGISRLDRRTVLPFALVISVVAAIVILPHVSSLIQIAALGAIGVALKRVNWPRAPFILGFVMGPLLELALSRTLTVFGSAALLRPGVIILLALAALMVAAAWRTRSRGIQDHEGGRPKPAPYLALFFLILFGAAGLIASGFRYYATILPFIAVTAGLGASLTILLQDRHALGEAPRPWRKLDRGLTVPALALGAAAPIVGLPLAAGLYVLNALAVETKLRLAWMVLIALAMGWLTFFLGGDVLGLISPFDRAWLWITRL